MSYLIAPFKFGFDIGERGGAALHRTYEYYEGDNKWSPERKAEKKSYGSTPGLVTVVIRQ